MRYSTLIDNKTSLEWGLSVHLSYLFSWIYDLPSWSDRIIIGSDVFYFASRFKAIEELPMLTDKPDTMYRYYKKLESMELIEVKKIDGKDYITLLNKSKAWNNYSEINPTNGNISELNSEKNPTYNIISNNNKENNKKKFIVPTVEEITQYCKERNNSINPQKFYDFYESKGWMVGKNKMKNWKAAVRTWETPKPSEDRPMEINGRKIAFYTEDGQPVFKKALR